MRHRIATAATVCLLSTGCGLDEIDVDASAEETVPGSPAGELPLSLTLGTLTTIDVAEELRRNDASLPDIDTARLRKLTLEARSGSAFDTFLEQIEVFAVGEGQPDRLVARAVGPFPTGTRVLACEVFPVDLEPYARSGVLSLNPIARGRPPREDTTVEARAVVRVGVDVSHFLGL